MSSNNNGDSELSCLAMVCLGLILTVVGGIIWIAAGSR